MGPSAVSEEHSGALSVQPQVSKVFFRSPTSKLYSSALFFLCSSILCCLTTRNKEGRE
jgi:hypothetical protein